MKPLALLLPLLCLPALADTDFTGSGTLAGAAITMTLHITDNGEVSGHYAYQKYQRPIALSGTVQGKKLALQTGQALAERFSGTLFGATNQITQIAGLWQGKSNAFDFVVSNQPDPYRDHQISCQEMAELPALVFSNNADLGSGSGSPNKVDYQCPQSLAQLDFLKSLLALADTIRDPNPLPQGCTGTMRFAIWRYHAFELAQLGYYPQKTFKGQDDSRYFKTWSYQSLYNRALYQQYQALATKALPKLSSWYQTTASVDATTAKAYADNALNAIANWAYGAHPRRLQTEQPVPHTEEAQAGNSQPFLNALAGASPSQKLASLRQLLVTAPDSPLISALLDAMAQIKEPPRSESPLSLAVTHPALLAALLKKGFNPNQQNDFGKTPLFYAIQFNQPQAVTDLLAAGADINHGYQLQDANDWRFQCAFNIEHWQRTPLMHAAQHSDVAMLTLLLANGARLDAKDSLGKTALDYAKDNHKDANAAFLQGVKP